MLIESFDLKIEISTHSTERFDYEATAHLNVDIGPALPYLNATLSRGIYLPDKPALSWRYDGHNVGFWAYRIAADDLESREQAQEVIQYLVDMVNQVWEKRDELEPDTTTHKRLQPLELYQLLPKTNCGACGEAGCFPFALKLVTGQAKLEQCTPLYSDPAFEGQRGKLESLLATKWRTLDVT